MCHLNDWTRLLFLSAVMGIPCAAVGQTPDPPTKGVVPPANCQVGEVSKNVRLSDTLPDGYCIEGRFFRGATHRLGRMNVFGAHGLEESADGQYAIVEGPVASDVFGQLKNEGPCPPPPFRGQWRSDWFADEGGYSNSEAQLRKAPYIQAQAAARLAPILSHDAPLPFGRRRRTQEPPPETREVRIQNPFDVPLEGLTVVIHYEGGWGKPMPRYERHSVDLLGAEKRVLSVPSTLVIESEKPHQGRGIWRFQGASLEGQSGGCRFWPKTHHSPASKVKETP